MKSLFYVRFLSFALVVSAIGAVSCKKDKAHQHDKEPVAALTIGNQVKYLYSRVSDTDELKDVTPMDSAKLTKDGPRDYTLTVASAFFKGDTTSVDKAKDSGRKSFVVLTVNLASGVSSFTVSKGTDNTTGNKAIGFNLLTSDSVKSRSFLKTKQRNSAPDSLANATERTGSATKNLLFIQNGINHYADTAAKNDSLLQAGEHASLVLKAGDQEFKLKVLVYKKGS